MIEETLFRIPYWTIPSFDFKNKQKKLTKLIKKFPEERNELQKFETNRQKERLNIVNDFAEIMSAELNSLSNILKKDIAITDVWSVSYKKGDYHTPHNHGAKGITGILYLELDKKNPGTNYIQPWNDFIQDTTVYYPIPVKEGDIIVVPKFIQHFTEPNNSTKVKKIISWDMNIL
jgi:hypothetical protein